MITKGRAGLVLSIMKMSFDDNETAPLCQDRYCMEDTMNRLAGTLMIIMVTAPGVGGCHGSYDQNKPITVIASVDEYPDVETASIVSRTDEDFALASEVRGQIALQDLSIDPDRLTVQAEADHGIVLIRGIVNTVGQKTRAEAKAVQVAGVSVVVNELRVAPRAIY
jgi:osmotically-inducible protein OsmY